MSRARGQVPVVAYCDNGHVTRAVSDPGRLTWEGICAEAGCGLKVKGKRAPADALPPVDTNTAVASVDDDAYRVREVTAYRDDRTRPTAADDVDDDNAASEPAGAEAGPAAAPAAPAKRAAASKRHDSRAPAPPTVPEPVAPAPTRRGFFDRAREWFAFDDADDADDVIGW